jgi:hypothetical protein
MATYNPQDQYSLLGYVVDVGVFEDGGLLLPVTRCTEGIESVRQTRRNVESRLVTPQITLRNKIAFYTIKRSNVKGIYSTLLFNQRW